MYNEKVIEYFTNPKNMGEIDDFDSFAEGGNQTCGDVVNLWIKLSKDKKKISDIKFKGVPLCRKAKFFFKWSLKNRPPR